MTDSFGARSTIEVGGREYEIHRLDALQSKFDIARLPYSIKVLLENVLRLEDGESVTADDVETIATWDAKAEPSKEIPFQPARVLMQDFTGVPAVCDLAAMRDAFARLGLPPTQINPLKRAGRATTGAPRALPWATAGRKAKARPSVVARFPSRFRGRSTAGHLAFRRGNVRPSGSPPDFAKPSGLTRVQPRVA